MRPCWKPLQSTPRNTNSKAGRIRTHWASFGGSRLSQEHDLVNAAEEEGVEPSRAHGLARLANGCHRRLACPSVAVQGKRRTPPAMGSRGRGFLCAAIRSARPPNHRARSCSTSVEGLPWAVQRASGHHLSTLWYPYTPASGRNRRNTFAVIRAHGSSHSSAVGKGDRAHREHRPAAGRLEVDHVRAAVVGVQALGQQLARCAASWG